MNPPDRAAPSLKHRGPWPAQDGGIVAFLPGEEAAAHRTTTRLFQRRLEAWEYAALAGAPDNAHVEIGAAAGQLYIELCDPQAAYRAYYYVRRTARRLVIINDGFQILLRKLRGRGLGLRVFRRQVAAASALSVDRIELVAGRRRDENGYYSWPRFGFDGVLPRSLRRTLPAGLDHARTVLDLMECETGRQWWREHGATINVVFDLAVGSRSRAVLTRYLYAKENFASGTKRNLEN
jgi:hypothetical protein